MEHVQTPPHLPEAPVRPRSGRLAPLEPVGGNTRWLLGLGFFVLFVLVWAGFTLGGFVSPTFLASPMTMAREGWLLFTEHNFIHDIGMTVWRVFGGFILASLIAVPLGIAMGTYKGVEAFFEPFVSFCRYLPASAFIPLLILWAGIGETQKILVIFIGSVFQIVLMVAFTVGGARRDLVEAAYTLGASDRGIINRVLMQELLLGIWESARKTVLFVTHDIDEAIFMANRVAVFSARPGRIKSDIAVNLPHPRHYTIKTSPEFMDLKARLTEEIRAESMASAEH